MLEEHKRYIIDFKDIPAPRAKMPELSPGERVGGFEEIEKGFSEEQAQREAKRCLSCRRCLGCKLCLAACEKEAIDFGQIEEEQELEVDAVIITPGAMRYPAPLDERFTCSSSANLVTDIEFERMIDPQGLYGGLLLRPSDGEIPRKMGFIFRAGTKAGRHSLVFLLKEAAAAHRKIEGIELWLFLPQTTEALDDCKALLEQIPQVTLKQCLVDSVTEIADTGNLAVEYREGEEKRIERFQMIVASTEQRLPETARLLADQLRLKLAQQVEPTEACEPVSAGRDGISIAGGIATG
jgi:heterodisulfide reductase subunit A-like polyferredoxin